MGDLDQTEVSERTGISQSNLSRWKAGKVRPSVENAVDFARLMPGGNPVEALVILGVVRPAELDQVVEVGATADDLTNGELVNLLARRLGVDLSRRVVRGA
jgi:transcriptional regulator with XRE-family HTH domain